MKRKISLMIVLVSALLALIGVFGYEQYTKEKIKLPTVYASVWDIADPGDYWVTVPALENRALSCDINGISFEGDSTIYLLMPEDVDETEVVYYLRDPYNNFMARVVSDFREEVVIGEKQIKLVKSKLPVMFIETAEEFGSFSDLLKSETKEANCYGDLYLSVSRENAKKNAWAEEFISEDYDEKVPQSMSLHPRGNMTWAGGRKKPFALRLEHAEDLLGMGKNKKWNLIANSQDKSLMKNEMFYQMAEEIGLAYTPLAENVSLYVDGNYQGVYLLTTKISVDKNRVNLKKGDFLVNWGAPNAVQKLTYTSDRWEPDSVTVPSYAELVWPENDTDTAWKQEFLQKLVTAIEDTGNDDYLEYLDIESMVKYYWVQEISLNSDAFYRSAYAYYKKDTGKLYMGPVWDMDMSNGSILTKEDIPFNTPEGWKIRECGWYAALFEHEGFREAAGKAYFEDGIRDEMYQLLEDMEQEKKRLSVDGELNYRLWTSEIIQYSLQYDVSSYEAHTDKEIEFYKRRIDWIDEQMQKEDW